MEAERIRRQSVAYKKPKENSSPNEDTFLVLVKRGGKFEVQRFNKARSLYLFRHQHPIRKFAIILATNPYFEYFILFLIVANCVFLALKDPPEEPEYVFACLYTLEMLVKIVARGFAFNKYAYLRDPWNALDFVVVILGWLTVTPYVANLSGVRTFRVLRALRTISQTKGLKTMVNTLLVSMRMLSDVLILILFFLCVFALLGMQLFMGVLRNKCALTIPENTTVTYSRYVSNSSNWLISNENSVICGNSPSGRHCPNNYSCYSDTGSNPNYDYTSFDHIGWALLTAFQLLTLDFWENVYNNILYAVGLWYFFFFALLVFLGPFYLINLVSAVVVTSYEMETSSRNEDGSKKSGVLATAFSAFTVPAGDSNSNKMGTKRRKDTNSSQRHRHCSVSPGLETEWDRKSDIYQIRELENKWSTTHTEEDATPTSSQLNVCWRKFSGLRKKLLWFVERKEFEGFITFCIAANTIFMATEHHGMSSSLETVIAVSNYIFTGIFFIEMIITLTAFGPTAYFRNSWCIFDFIVVLISLVDIALEVSGTTGVGLRVLRTLRLLRVLKLAKSWTTMADLLAATTKSLGAFCNLALIMCIVLYMFAVTGMQLFGDSYTADVFGTSIPRWNFTDFFHSFMLIFRVVCGEWIEPLWNCMRASHPGAVFLFIPAFVMGNFVVLNLFLALVVNSFSREHPPISQQGEKVTSKMLRTALAISFSVTNFLKKGQVHPMLSETSKASETDSGLRLSRCSSVEDGKNETTRSENLGEQSDTSRESESECKPEAKSRVWWTGWLAFQAKIERVVQNKFFESFILIIIFISSACLAFEDVRLRDDKDLQNVLYCLDITFVVIFSLEFLLKLIGLGFVRYFTNGWNCLDLTIVVISILSLTVRSDLAAFRSLRTLRALRPLRAISRFEGLKIVIGSLFSAIPGISNVLLVGLLSWLIFSIMGVQLFGGKFYKCINDQHAILNASQVPNKTVCLDKGYRWQNSNINYDNVINGLIALSQVATLEGWIEIMRDAVDATGVDLQPKHEYNFAAYIYFVVFIILGSFFILNLIVGVIIDKFSRMKQLYEDTGSTGIFLSNQQMDWLNTLKRAASKKPSRTAERPKNFCRAFLFDVVQSNYFEISIMFVIALNMTTMMSEYYGQSHEMDQTLDYLNYFFTGIFIVEAVLRITALGTFYFRVPWNVFDFVVVVLSTGGIMLETLQNFDFVKLSVLRGIRAFRVARLLRFIKVAKGIRKLTYAFVLSLPALFNICILLVLIISIYAIVGMTSFGFVKKTGALNDVVNFETFIRSFVLLFRLMTSAGWNDILDALMIQRPDCDPSHLGLGNGNCGRPVLAQFYFVSFVIITYITLVNMYIAIILENFNRIYKKAKVGITDDDIDMYYSRWALYDPKATEYIHFDQLSDFVDELNQPLRVPKSDGKAGVGGMDISLRDGDRVHCLDLLHALVRHLVLQEFPKGGGEYNVVMERLEERFMKTFPSRNVYVPISTVKQRTMEIKAALVIQRAVKRFKNARETSSRKPSVRFESQNLHQRKVTGLAQKRADSRSNLPVDDGICTAGSSPPRDLEPNKSQAVLSTVPPAVCSSSGLKISDDLSLKSVSSDSST